jgi:hypothetical protein
MKRSGYDKDYYDNTGKGLNYTVLWGPGEVELAKLVEKMHLAQYRTTHGGQLPPGNTKMQ